MSVGARWVGQVITNRGKSAYAANCTPGYYNFEGEAQRRQDGNYNGGINKYYEHLEAVGGSAEGLSRHFEIIT
jgi:hypothetical protein